MSESNQGAKLGGNALKTKFVMNTGEKEGKVDKQIPKKKVAFYKLFSFSDSRDKVLMIIGTIAAIGSGLSLPIMAIIFGEIIDVFGAAQNADNVSLVSKVALKFVYLALGSGAASFLLSCWMITGERQSARIRTLYLQTILQQDIAFYDQEASTGEVIGRMSDDTILIHDAMGEKVGEFVHVISSFLGSFAIAFGKGWLLALVLSTSIPLVVMSSVIMSFLRFRMTLRTQKAYADAANVVQQTIGSIRTVESFTGENHAVAHYNKFLTASYKTNINMQSSIGLGAGFVKLTMFCTYSLAVWFGAKMILQKDYTGGEVYTILYAVIMGSNSLGHASAPMTAFAAGQAAAFKMFETINRKPSIDAYDPKGNTLNDICGNIEFRNVCFSYPTRPKEKIFDEFSLLIPSGTTVALVGQSGSGKSTVISLIERFYDPLSGGVLIDGIDLREFQLKWIRSKIGLVSQEPVLFTTSIKDNIAYGKDGATLEEITAAAKLANAKNFIDKLPQGLDTMVGEHGAQLSGGQKQRIAIARAILKDPRILLFDEATSALDADSERIVQEALDNIMVNRTTVIVAHRLSTIRNADMIAVLHQGIIVEKGTHFELLKDSQGVYSNLIYSQEVHDDVEQNTYSREMESVTKCEDCSQNMSSMCSIISGLSEVENASSRPLSLSLSKTTIDSSNALSPKITIKLPDVSIFRLAHLNKPEAPVLVLGAIVSMITGAILPIFGLLTSFMISNFFKSPDKLKRDSEFWALMYIILGVVSLIAHPSKAYLFTVAGNMLIKRIRFMCFKKVVNMQMGWFDMPENSSGVICARLFTDASRIRALVGDALSVHIHEAASVLVALVISFIASWQLTLIILVILPMLGLNGYLQEKSTKGFSKDAKVKYEEASHIASDAVGNIRTVASFCAQERIIQMYKEKCEGPATDGTKEGLISGIGYGVASSLRFFFYAISFYAAARLVEDGKTSFSHVFRVLFALSMMSLALSSSSARTPDKSKAKSAVASVFAILDTKSMIDPSDESGVILENIKGDIELSHVNFSYPARPDVQILGDLSLTVHAGKIVALVGESGSGKSTVISLLQRFYDPDSGFITLDGVELRKFQVKWLRQQMGLVSQEPVLFNDTIRANIAYGKGGTATEAEIIAAAKSANAHEFISGLQQGYDTVVGERGVQLSGGQKQRVAIARAIVKGPKIVLLDEATSALDAESEKIVQEALDRVMVNRTTVVVAHRLSTIRGADEIAVFRNGRIVEKGNHNTLTNITNGFYSSLISLQTIAHS